jgi:GntR family transcriptional regulator
VFEFQLDPTSGVATYLQLVHQVRQALRLGVLRPGDQLPTAREVVAKLAINPNTVLKAYRDLEREHLVSARPGQGTFILRTLDGPGAGTSARFARELASWMSAAKAAGLGGEDIEAIYRATVRDTFAEGVA